MNSKEIIAVTGFLACLLWITPTFAEKDSGRPNLLEKVQVNSSPDSLSFEIKFNRPVVDSSLQFFKRSIQLDIPGGRVEPDKRYFPTGDSEIVRVYASQSSPGMARIRFMLAKSIPDAEERFHIDQQGRHLNIYFDKPVSDPLESLLARATRIKKMEEIRLAKEFQTANSIKSTTKVQTEASVKPEASRLPEKLQKEKPLPLAKKQTAPIPAKKVEQLSEIAGEQPAPEVASQKEKNPPIKDARELLNPVEATVKGADMWSASLKMFYALGIVLGMVFLLYYLVKKFFLKNGVFGNESKPIKILSTGFLAPKKSIALVEIPGEVLVLGIAHENISLLGNIREPGQISRITGKPPQTSEPIPKDPVSPAREKKEEEKTLKGVDLYKSRRKKPASTNPFPEYVRRFAENNPRNSPSVTEVTSQIRKNLRRVRSK